MVKKWYTSHQVIFFMVLKRLLYPYQNFGLISHLLLIWNITAFYLKQIISRQISGIEATPLRKSSIIQWLIFLGRTLMLTVNGLINTCLLNRSGKKQLVVLTEELTLGEM